MGPVEKLLRKAGALITPLGSICTGEYARDMQGSPVGPRRTSAVQWCAIGAVRAAVDPLGAASDWAQRRANDLLASAARRRGFKHPVGANDMTGGVITPDLYSDAIEAAAELGL